MSDPAWFGMDLLMKADLVASVKCLVAYLATVESKKLNMCYDRILPLVVVPPLVVFPIPITFEYLATTIVLTNVLLLLVVAPQVQS
jgi:hypothetical protein